MEKFELFEIKTNLNKIVSIHKNIQGTNDYMLFIKGKVYSVGDGRLIPIVVSELPDNKKFKPFLENSFILMGNAFFQLTKELKKKDHEGLYGLLIDSETKSSSFINMKTDKELQRFSFDNDASVKKEFNIYLKKYTSMLKTLDKKFITTVEFDKEAVEKYTTEKCKILYVDTKLNKIVFEKPNHKSYYIISIYPKYINGLSKTSTAKIHIYKDREGIILINFECTDKEGIITHNYFKNLLVK